MFLIFISCLKRLGLTRIKSLYARTPTHGHKTTVNLIECENVCGCSDKEVSTSVCVLPSFTDHRENRRFLAACSCCVLFATRQSFLFCLVVQGASHRWPLWPVHDSTSKPCRAVVGVADYVHHGVNTAPHHKARRLTPSSHWSWTNVCEQNCWPSDPRTFCLTAPGCCVPRVCEITSD